MSKYIDAEKLKAEVEKRREDIKAYCLNPNHDKRYDVVPEQLAYILDIIDSLQQEQPEVDFEKEWDEFEDWMESYITSDYPTYYAPKEIARHFYELGLKARKEEKK